MTFFNTFLHELIFWLNWCMAWVTTLGIWYCWFMALRIGFLGKLNYGVSQYPIQDSVVDFLVLIKLIKQEYTNSQPYVPQTLFGFQFNILGYLAILIISFILVPFCYYHLSTYNIIIPKDKDITHNALFDFIFKGTLRSMLFGTISGFILLTIGKLSMEGKYEQNNVRDFGGFLLVFCLTSLIMGSGAIWGIGYLIDIFRYK